MDISAVWQLDHAAPLDQIAIAAERLPEGDRILLDHHNSMTQTLEAWSGQAVSLNVLAKRQLGRHFRRKIELVCAPERVLLRAGIQIDLNAFPPDVQLEIIAGDKPYGTVLCAAGIAMVHTPQGFFSDGCGRFGRCNRIEGEDGTLFADVIELLLIGHD